MEKQVCCGHFTDKTILDFIEENGAEGSCFYCKPRYQVGKVISLKELVEFMDDRLSYFYNHPDEEYLPHDSNEGEEYGWYTAKVFDTWDLLYDEVGLDVDIHKLQSDIVSAFNYKMWCYLNVYESRPHEALTYGWKNFSQLVKHRMRYSFFIDKSLKSDKGKPLATILNDIAQHARKLGLIRNLSTGTSIYRCHQHAVSEKLESFERLTSPPVKYAIQPNRMSPAGISMFYGAFEKEVARKEIFVQNDLVTRPHFTVGEFKPLNPLQLIDFTQLPELPSIFDKKKRDIYYPVLFFSSFRYELSKPIDWDGRQHIKYVPTQILTEYFRYVFPELTGININGLMYGSSKSPGQKCCVLFMDNKESKEYLKLDSIEST